MAVTSEYVTPRGRFTMLSSNWVELVSLNLGCHGKLTTVIGQKDIQTRETCCLRPEAIKRHWDIGVEVGNWLSMAAVWLSHVPFIWQMPRYACHIDDWNQAHHCRRWFQFVWQRLDWQPKGPEKAKLLASQKHHCAHIGNLKISRQPQGMKRGRSIPVWFWEFWETTLVQTPNIRIALLSRKSLFSMRRRAGLETVGQLLAEQVEKADLVSEA